MLSTTRKRKLTDVSELLETSSPKRQLITPSSAAKPCAVFKYLVSGPLRKPIKCVDGKVRMKVGMKHDATVLTKQALYSQYKQQGGAAVVARMKTLARDRPAGAHAAHTQRGKGKDWYHSQFMLFETDEQACRWLVAQPEALRTYNYLIPSDQPVCWFNDIDRKPWARKFCPDKAQFNAACVSAFVRHLIDSFPAHKNQILRLTLSMSVATQLLHISFSKRHVATTRTASTIL